MVSFGTTFNVRLSESAWLRTAVNSGKPAAWAAVKAIWAEDNWSKGFDTEAAVELTLFKVLLRTVWLADRLVTINRLTIITSKTLPAIIPYLTNFFRDFLSRLENLGIVGKASSWLAEDFVILELM
jgi:hypothetical protein